MGRSKGYVSNSIALCKWVVKGSSFALRPCCSKPADGQYVKHLETDLKENLEEIDSVS